MRRALVLALVLAVAPAAARAQDPVDLKWTLKEGTTFYSKTGVVQKQQMTLFGQKVDLTMEINAGLSYKVKSVTQDTAVIEVTYLDTVVEVKGLPIPGLADMGKKAKGTVVTVTVKDSTEVTKVEGAGKIEEKFKEAEGIEKDIGSALFNEAIVREMVSMPFAILPGKKVKSGDEWTKDEKSNAAGLDVSGKTKYKVDEIKDGVAKVSTTGDLKVKMGAGGGGLPFKISKADLKVEKATSNYSFDVKAGQLKELVQEMVISGDLTAVVDGADLTITMTTNQKVKVSISDKPPTRD